MKAKLLRISSIGKERSLYPRSSFDHKLAQSYADAMKGGAHFPPIVVAVVDKKLTVIDGWHRLEAAKKLKLSSIQVKDLGPLTRTKAFAEAVRLNSLNGKPLDYAERLAAFNRLVKEGVPIQVVADTIVFSPPEKLRIYAGRMSGVRSDVEANLASHALVPLAPVMTVKDEHGFAGSISMKQNPDGTVSLGPASALLLIRMTVSYLSKGQIAWGNRELVVSLRRLRELMIGMRFPAEN